MSIQYIYHPGIIFLLLTVLLLIVSCSPDAPGNGDEEPDEPYSDVVFRDDFNDDTIDTSVWQIATWEKLGNCSTQALEGCPGFTTSVAFLFFKESYETTIVPHKYKIYKKELFIFNSLESL